MVTISDRLPKPGETVIAHQFYIAQGGKGANQAVAAARLGGQVTFVCKVGADDFGKKSIVSYQKEGINTDFIYLDQQAPTGTALINIDDKGENMIVATMGANAHLQVDEVSPVFEKRQNVDVVVSQLEIPLETVVFVARKARECGIPFILNPAPPNQITDELIGLTDFIIPNETEAEIYTGIKVMDEQSASYAAKELVRRGAKTVVITMGAKGAFLCNEVTEKLIPAPQVVAIDTVGAGDTFCGSFAVAIAEGKSAEEAIYFANRCASIAVTRAGAQQGIPYKNEIN